MADVAERAGVEAAALIECRELPQFRATDPQAIWRALRNETPLRLRQAWRIEAEPDFSPGTVRVGWRGGQLLVFAELTDPDIFSAATEDNQKTWRLGDTFEMFLRPAGQQSYVELHVTPNNQRLQLRYAEGGGANGDWEDALVSEELFRSATWLWPEADRWFVFAEITVAAVGGNVRSEPGSRWRFSFARYDYRRGRAEPILSATAAHAAPDFHRHHEWGWLRFESGAMRT